MRIATIDLEFPVGDRAETNYIYRLKNKINELVEAHNNNIESKKYTDWRSDYDDYENLPVEKRQYLELRVSHGKDPRYVEVSTGDLSPGIYEFNGTLRVT